MKQKKIYIALFLIPLLTLMCSISYENEPRLTNAKISIEYNNKMYSRLFWNSGQTLVNKNFTPTEFIVIGRDTIKDFIIQSVDKNHFEDRVVLIITGLSNNVKYEIQKKITATALKNNPGIILTQVSYINLSKDTLNITEWVNNDYRVNLKDTSETVWSYQSGSYEERPDWVRKVPYGFRQENYMGMNASDYGGGTPVVDVWTKNYGIAIGHLETVPKLVSLPVSRDDEGVAIKIKYKKDISLKPNDTLSTFTTFVSVHHGDYFNTLRLYAKLMAKRGVKINKAPEISYEPVWCAWGYERNFKVEDILKTLPKVKELGFKWAVLDDGWQTSEGDWYLNPSKFPNGDADMKALVDKIHSYGLKAKLWWVPLAVDPGTDLIKNYPNMVLINKNGKPQDISWWDSYYLCPAYKPTLEYTKKLIKKFIVDWGFDGLKIDGQHLNAAPPCFNPKHHHKYPEESTEAMPNFFKTIYEEVEKYKPESVVEVCPCGTGYNYFMLPYLNQVVASDPTSSWQIRLKGKTFKALMGRDAPYYGDHVELSDSGTDFASTVGVGGIIGTKFVWPVGVHLNTESGDVSLSTEREKEWQKWIDIYNKYKLSEGEYLGELYDIGFDRPEAHVIKKDETLYYAFFADKYEGEIELRGLGKTKLYDIYNYITNKYIGKLNGLNPKVKVNFKKYLFIKVDPQQK